ncbi:hypothetical protein EJ06DRAFT_91965 [Trichodelitschia bisporula]|uniref:Uncharacterized protein n=1 Tax=Trichodelitschia bisporula TaxID=703511 RepID=A0A6G1HSC9_9PEZI|nr:hypothetical protein EJ06DRAFT_91965 [Trichodelitschia bisporula]
MRPAYKGAAYRPITRISPACRIPARGIYPTSTNAHTRGQKRAFQTKGEGIYLNRACCTARLLQNTCNVPRWNACFPEPRARGAGLDSPRLAGTPRFFGQDTADGARMSWPRVGFMRSGYCMGLVGARALARVASRVVERKSACGWRNGLDTAECASALAGELACAV